MWLSPSHVSIKVPREVIDHFHCKLSLCPGTASEAIFPKILWNSNNIFDGRFIHLCPQLQKQY